LLNWDLHRWIPDPEGKKHTEASTAERWLKKLMLGKTDGRDRAHSTICPHGCPDGWQFRI
jgi:hypothetical protein